MIFTHKRPENWRELQDLTAELLRGAGYKATTPCIIETVRGEVEVDVLIETPFEFVKTIVCECKCWNTRVTKEKVHAFRSVVYDFGAELGLMISSRGYQSGAEKAAKYSNVRLETWEGFLEIIKDRWINYQLTTLKAMARKISRYILSYSYNYEDLREEELPIYWETRENLSDAVSVCNMLQKSYLFNDDRMSRKPYNLGTSYDSIDEYICAMGQILKEGLTKLNGLSVSPQELNVYVASMEE